MDKPKASIVIRTFNEEKHLGNLLQAISEQEYTDYEILIVDSGSTDRTLEIAKKFPVTVLPIESRDFTFGYSLNVGCDASKGDYLIFLSAHTLPVDTQWLANMVAPFKTDSVGMVYGRQVGSIETKFSEKQDFEYLFGASSNNSAVPVYYANNANSAVRKSLWKERHFDEYLFGLEDIEWAKYITDKGYSVHYESQAAVYHIHEESWSQVFNRYRREAIAAFRIGLPHPPQARIDFLWILVKVAGDLSASFPNWSRGRLKEIFDFRYFQWTGTRQGWFADRELDFDRARYSLFYPPANTAVVIKDAKHVVITDIPIPEMKPGDILIKVEYVGVCQTDIEVYEGTLGYFKDAIAKYPIVPGHEFSGTIIKIGASTKYREKFSVGQKVVGECILSRDTSNRKEVGVINHNGAYAQYVIVPGSFIHAVPEGMDMQVAALAEPLAVVLRGLRRLGEIPKNAKVAVMGAGPIGNLCAQVLSMRGYSVTAFDSNEKRLTHLEGMVAATSSTVSNLSEFSIIIEATGSRTLLEQVLQETSTGSSILLLGFPYGNTTYNFEDVVAHEKLLVGSVGAESEDFVVALNLLSKLDTRAFIEATLPLTSFKEAWSLQSRSEYLKVHLMPPSTDTESYPQ